MREELVEAQNTTSRNSAIIDKLSNDKFIISRLYRILNESEKCCAISLEACIGNVAPPYVLLSKATCAEMYDYFHKSLLDFFDKITADYENEAGEQWNAEG
jgi:hypothetical protein